MIEVTEQSTIGEAFAQSVAAYGANPFHAVPSNRTRAYCPEGYEITFEQARRDVEALIACYRAAGFGPGHRVAMLLENRPEHVLHRLALNTLGASCVPLNPDYRASEMAYVLSHAKVDLALVISSRRPQLAAALNASAWSVPIATAERLAEELGPAARPATAAPITGASEASVLYTSGTTGRPKGCILSHGYELVSGAWYATRGHLATIREGCERIYNPLPLYHVNSGILTFFGAMLTGNCHVQTDRFHPERWWREVDEQRATVVHYLGVIVPMLLGAAPSARDRRPGIRFGIGAGVEPQLHAVFEERFGFPLIEVWGMTEMVRVLLDNVAPRPVGTRAFGRAVPGIDVRVVDEKDSEVPDGIPGEMTIRHSAEAPRKAFFSGYLDDPEATEAAWRGGWFHTGDVVARDAGGMLHFVDRKKNIIRRSGENIAAAEIEALLQANEMVKQVAVLAVPDPVREEEVMACIVLRDGVSEARAADALFQYCYDSLAYYKAPGWIYFRDSLPTTGTQKIQKHQIFPTGTDPLSQPGLYDLRARKKRTGG